MKYEEAYIELQKIVHDIENEDVSVDDLTKKVKRASELIQICRDKLVKTEQEVEEAMQSVKLTDDL